MAFPLRLPLDSPLLTITHPTPTVWVIELHNGEDNRLTKSLIGKAFSPALDIVERSWRSQRDEQLSEKDAAKNLQAGAGALVIVGNRAQDKFFSNGLDFPEAISDPGFMANYFTPLLIRLLTFPLPTVAALNGHCFAGGFVVTLFCDFRIMTDGSKRPAWMSMNEVLFGALIPLLIARVYRAKIGDGRVLRKIYLDAHRFTPPEALEAGLVDALVKGNTTEVLAHAVETAMEAAPHARMGVWGLIKRDVYRDICEAAEPDLRMLSTAEEASLFHARL